MGSITLSCGCVDKPPIDIIYGSADCDAVQGFLPCLVFAVYCEDCAQELRVEGIPIFDDEADGDIWLEAQH